MGLPLVGGQLHGKFQSARLNTEILSQNKRGSCEEFSSGVPCTRIQVWQASGSVQDHSELQSKTMTQKAERGLGHSSAGRTFSPTGRTWFQHPGNQTLWPAKAGLEKVSLALYPVLPSILVAILLPQSDSRMSSWGRGLLTVCILGSGQLLFPQLCQGHRRLSPGAAWVLNSAFQGWKGRSERDTTLQQVMGRR